MQNYTLNNEKLQELKKEVNNTITHYKNGLIILQELSKHLKSKKDGSDFKNVKNIFDIENFKTNILNDLDFKYYKQCFYLEITEYDFIIYYYNAQNKNLFH